MIMTTNFKVKRCIDEDYLAWIRTQPCLVCKMGSVPHHTVSKGAGGSDLKAVPLCPDHHNLGGDSIHRLGRTTFCTRYRIDLAYEIERLREKYERDN